MELISGGYLVKSRYRKGEWVVIYNPIHMYDVSSNKTMIGKKWILERPYQIRRRSLAHPFPSLPRGYAQYLLDYAQNEIPYYLRNRKFTTYDLRMATEKEIKVELERRAQNERT